LRKVWKVHYMFDEDDEPHWRAASRLPKAAEVTESPYDPEAKHSNKRGLVWVGYKVHLTETCDEQLPRLITNVHTTVATEQDVGTTALIEAALNEKKLLPTRHLVDAGYISAEMVIASRLKYDIELFGPTRVNPSWQARDGGYDAAQFKIDWDLKTVVCPEGKLSSYWHEYEIKTSVTRPVVTVKFKSEDCRNCPSRAKCVRHKNEKPRQLLLPARELHQALKQTRTRLSSRAARRFAPFKIPRTGENASSGNRRRDRHEHLALDQLS
jgi:transposase